MALLTVGALLIAAAIALWVLPRNSRRHWMLLGRMAAGILMCGSALTLLLFLFSGAMCGGYEFSPFSSRDGKLAAEVSEEDCGAGTRFTVPCISGETDRVLSRTYSASEGTQPPYSLSDMTLG
jgi:hypothetical protein